jgi:hypothetical protein
VTLDKEEVGVSNAKTKMRMIKKRDTRQIKQEVKLPQIETEVPIDAVLYWSKIASKTIGKNLRDQGTYPSTIYVLVTDLVTATPS